MLLLFLYMDLLSQTFIDYKTTGEGKDHFSFLSTTPTRFTDTEEKAG